MLVSRYGGKIPVYINGCIKDDASLKAALALAPDADGVMISRAAAQKPWIFDGTAADSSIDVMKRGAYTKWEST